MLGLCNVFMRTYRTTRSLNLVYTDGNSAFLTLQGLWIPKISCDFNGKVRGCRYEFEERERAEGLCWRPHFCFISSCVIHLALEQVHGAGGLASTGLSVRNTGFELIKCSFEDGLELVNNLNIAQWMRDIESDNTVEERFPCRTHGPKQFDTTRIDVI